MAARLPLLKPNRIAVTAADAAHWRKTGIAKLVIAGNCTRRHKVLS
jgi:hypothetical protein